MEASDNAATGGNSYRVGQPPGATERGASRASGAPAERSPEGEPEVEGASEGGPTGPTENERRCCRGVVGVSIGPSVPDSTPDRSGSSSWPSNGSNPAQRDTGPKTADLESGRPSDLPLPEERIRGLLERYPKKMFTPISTAHERKLRIELLEDEVVEMREREIGELETEMVPDVVSRPALPLVAVMDEFLEWYEGYRDKYLRMVKGDGFREARKEFLVELENSFQPGYQKRTYAKLQALRRQTAGGEYPDGSECSGAFEEPTTVLFGLTSSGTEEDGTPRPIVDHAREVREAWVDSSESVKRSLRYVLEDKFGLSSDEYVWWYQSEPHPGDGANAGYSHAHPVVVFDRAAASVESVDVEDFRTVVQRHIDECLGAEWSAHDLDEAVTVKEPGEIEDFAQYVSEYVAVSPDEDLLQRSDEYLMFAAANWASTSQKYSKSGTATAAIEADKCHQRYADEDAHQDADHGEEVARQDGEVVCWHCKESFGVGQSGTLTERRVAADGGAVSSASGSEQDGDSGGLQELWQDARAAGRVGGETVERDGQYVEEVERPSFNPVRLGGGEDYCSACGEVEPGGECTATGYREAEYSQFCPVPPEHYGDHTVVEGEADADVVVERDGSNYRAGGEIPIEYDEPASCVGEVESFGRRPATWEPDAIVQLSSGEETTVGAPGGVQYGKVIVEGAGSVGAKIDRGHLLPEWLEGPEPWKESPVTEEEVRSGELPPPELVHREYAELHHGQPVTRKEWSDDWYAERYGCHGVVGDEGGSDEIPIGPVERYIENNPAATAMEVVARTGVDPAHLDRVEEMVG